MIEQLSSFIIHLIQSTGYLGIFVLMTLESALIPIPSEITMPFAGFLVGKGELNFGLVVLVGALANLAGSLLAYGLGFYLEENVILKFISRYGKFLLLSTHDYEKSTNWLRKYGDAVTFFSRLLPAVRTFISLPAGLAEMNIVKFSIYTFLGSLLWSGFLTYIGVYLGSKWQGLAPLFHEFQLVIGVLLVLLVAFYLNHKLKIFKRLKII